MGRTGGARSIGVERSVVLCCVVCERERERGRRMKKERMSGGVFVASVVLAGLLCGAVSATSTSASNRVTLKHKPLDLDRIRRGKVLRAGALARKHFEVGHLG